MNDNDCVNRLNGLVRKTECIREQIEYIHQELEEISIMPDSRSWIDLQDRNTVFRSASHELIDQIAVRMDYLKEMLLEHISDCQMVSGLYMEAMYGCPQLPTEELLSVILD